MKIMKTFIYILIGLISTEINVTNQEYVINIEDDGANLSNLSVASSTNLILDLDITVSYKIGDLPILFLSPQQIVDYSTLSFNSTVIPTETYLIVWKLIQGTISFSTFLYSLAQISAYANTQVSALQLATFSSSVNHVIGTNTMFLSDFAVNDMFLANNELGTVSILLSNTTMDIYVPPSSPYTNVPAYKIIAGP